MMLGWLRPLRREAWRLAPDWRQAHKFMSTQALGLGTACLTVFIAIGASKTLLLATLIITAVLVLVGNLTDQPELEDEADG